MAFGVRARLINAIDIWSDEVAVNLGAFRDDADEFIPVFDDDELIIKQIDDDLKFNKI